MSRTRLISPAFFKDADLYDAEQASGLPIRVAFAGLWTVCDKAGRFPWKPRDLKADVMPHDAVDFAAVLDVLHERGFVRRYVVDSKHYGMVPSWSKYQHPHKTERPSTLPEPLANGWITVRERVNAVAVAVTDTGTNYSVAAPPEQSERPDDTASLWPLIREKLYPPDGTPPTDWDERREGSVLKQLRKHYDTAQIAAAIEGLALLRDHPGKYAEPVSWMEPGVKLTLRTLYNTRSGVRAVFGLATQAYWKSTETRAENGKRSPAPLAAVLAQ